MKSLIYSAFGFLFSLGSLNLDAQTIAVRKLLDFQKSSQIAIQDSLELNNWNLIKVVTLERADSTVFKSSVTPIFLDAQKQNSSFAFIDFNNAAWIEYENEKEVQIKGNSYINGIAIKLPAYNLFGAFYLGKRNPSNHKFSIELVFSYFGDSIHKEIIKEIAALKIPQNLCSVETYQGDVTRVYRFKDQVIRLKSYNVDRLLTATTHDLAIYSKEDNDYLFGNNK
jgi:hypothetical protein